MSIGALASCDDEDWYDYLSSSDKSQAESLAQLLVYAFLISMPTMILIALVTKNKGGWLNSIWNTIAYLQFVRWLPAIDFEIPPYYMTFMKQFVDIIDYDEIYSNSSGEEISQSQLEHLGVSDSLFIKNAQLYLGLWAFSIVVYIIWAAAWRQWMSSSLRNSILLRTFFATLLDMMIFACIQIYYYDFSSTIPLISTAIAITYLAQVLLLAIILPTLVRRYTASGGSSQVGYRCIFEQAGYNQKCDRYMYYPLFVIRGVGTAVFLVFSYDRPQIAASSVGILQILFLLYIFVSKPFENRAQLIGVYINELFILLAIAHIWLYLQDGWSYDERKYSSIAQIGMIVLNSLAQIVLFTITICMKQKQEKERKETMKVAPENKFSNGDQIATMEHTRISETVSDIGNTNELKPKRIICERWQSEILAGSPIDYQDELEYIPSLIGKSKKPPSPFYSNQGIGNNKGNGNRKNQVHFSPNLVQSKQAWERAPQTNYIYRHSPRQDWEEVVAPQKPHRPQPAFEFAPQPPSRPKSLVSTSSISSPPKPILKPQVPQSFYSTRSKASTAAATPNGVIKKADPNSFKAALQYLDKQKAPLPQMNRGQFQPTHTVRPSYMPAAGRGLRSTNSMIPYGYQKYRPDLRMYPSVLNFVNPNDDDYKSFVSWWKKDDKPNKN